MNCEHVQEMLLSDYHDGRLGASKRQIIDKHLAGCPECRQLSERIYTQSIKPFNQTTEVMPDEFCWSQIKRRIQEQPVPARKSAWAFRPAWVMASVCGMLLVGAVAFQQYTNNQTPYISYVFASDNVSNDEVSSNIEEYFL